MKIIISTLSNTLLIFLLMLGGCKDNANQDQTFDRQAIEQSQEYIDALKNDPFLAEMMISASLQEFEERIAGKRFERGNLVQFGNDVIAHLFVTSTPISTEDVADLDQSNAIDKFSAKAVKR